MADSNRKGSFLLSDVRQRSLDGFWENDKTNAQFAWFGGGSVSPGMSSRIERIDFANDTNTAVTRNVFLTGRWIMAAVSTADYGWWAGGYVSPAGGGRSTVERMEFANDTASVAFSTRGPLSVTRSSLAGAANTNYGWFGGGSVAPAPLPQERSFVDRIAFANDGVTASPRGPLSLARFGLTAATDLFYGWFIGGSNGPTLFSTVDRIDFANDSPTTALARNGLTVGRSQASASSNRNYAWIHSQATTYLDRIDFSNDLILPSRRGTLTAARGYAGSASNNNFGWFAGGQTPTTVSTIERLDFSNDSPVSGGFRGPLTQAKIGLAGVSGIRNYYRYETQSLGSNEALSGYNWVGGGSPTPGLAGISTIDRINFSNDTITAAQRTFFNPRWGSSGFSNSNYGWFAGGYIPGSTTVSSIERVDFSNDSGTSITSVRGNLRSTNSRQGTSSNQNYGWVVGGFNFENNVQRLDFSNDLAGTVTRAAITQAPGANSSGMEEATGIGNADYGWFVGRMSTGLGVVDASHVQRLQYSNDLIGTLVRGSLSGSRTQLAGTANSNFGWWIGGYQTITRQSTVLRIDFSNDSPTASSPRGFLPLAINRQTASGNSSFGWASGGSTNTPAIVSTVYRIEFANDLASASTRGPLTLVRQYATSVSNYVKPSVGQQTWELPFQGNRIDGTYAWLGGGSPGVGFSTVQRIDFNNDTASPNIRGPLSSARYSLAAAGNANYGWFFGGSTGINAFSRVDRIDFANDSPASAITRQNLNQSRAFLAAVGNVNFGWVIGGDNNQTPLTRYSIIERISWSNDNISSIRGSLIAARGRSAAANNAYYGWVVGGDTAVTVSLVDRIDFANDSPTSASPRGFLSTVRSNIAAAANANYMWISGGSSVQIDRIDLANDSPAVSSQRGLSPVPYWYNSQAGNANFSWIAGDQLGNTSISRIDYANDSPTSASVRASLPASRQRMGGVSNYVILPNITNVTQYSISANSVGTGAGTFGWIAGGDSAGPVQSIVYRIDFANDSPTSASTRGPLSASRTSIGTNENNAYGWLVAGFNVSIIDRINFANDSPTTAQARAQAGVAKYTHAGASNTNYGWTMGGGRFTPPSISTVERIDFSNDQVALSIRGPLPAIGSSLTAAGNNNFAWVTGNSQTTVYRIDFSNDSPSAASVRGNMSSTVTLMGSSAASNGLYGWWGGGFLPAVSTVQRIDFANDSPTSASTRGPLSSARYNLSITSNANFGWFIGGSVGPPTAWISRVDRIDFANDSPTSASIRGPLPQGYRNSSATSNYTK